MEDLFDLGRFIDAQASAYASAVEELKRGRKTGHWIWYIFPQVAGLGHSHMSRGYAIASLQEARAYAEHPLLGPRLAECIQLVMAVEEKSADQILGHVDAMKFRSCLTLFARACDDDPTYQAALEKYFGGEPDPLTDKALCVMS